MNYWKCRECENLVYKIKPCYLVTGNNYEPRVCPQDTEGCWEEVEKEQFMAEIGDGDES